LENKRINIDKHTENKEKESNLEISIQEAKVNSINSKTASIIE
jgi:hypothetical protein